MAVAGALLILAGLGIGGGTLAVIAMSGRQSPQGSGPVETPTRERFLVRVDEAMRGSDWAGAEAILLEAVAIYDQDQDLRLQLSDVLRKRSDSDGAYAQVLAALQIGPATPEIEFRAGLLASESERREAALEHFQAARGGSPTNAEYALYLAQAHLALNQVEQAKATLVATVHLDPESATAWGTLGEIFLRENKVEMAIENVRRARALQPEVAVWRLVEARALKRQGEAEEALQLLLGLPGPEQRDGPVLALIAECYALLGRPAEAAARYGAASDVRPTDARLALEAAEWFRRLPDLERARYYADRAAMLGDAAGAALAAELRGA